MKSPELLFIEEIVHKHVPEVLELKFGCAIKIIEPRFASGKGIYAAELKIYQEKPLRIITVTTDPEVFLVATTIGFEHFSWRDIDRHCEILGRDIQLFDCAQVVKDKHTLIDKWEAGALQNQRKETIEWIASQLVVL